MPTPAQKQELFSIGEVAKMYHLSVGTLRHYERLGLLQPEYTDPDTGYRYYGTRQFECLNTIRYLRVLDTPLPQIADFLKNRDVHTIQALLCQQKAAVARKQRELQTIARKLENRLQQLQDAQTAPLNTVELVQSPPRRIAWIRHSIAITGYLDLEPALRQLEGDQKDTVVFLGKVGVGIAQERLEQRQYGSYDLVFLLLDDEDAYQGPTGALPAQTCARLRFCGSHREAPQYYAQLAAFIAAQGLAIDGFSREITMIDYGFTNDPRQFVTEIQIPVRG